jgi:hypothetical protein
VPDYFVVENVWGPEWDASRGRREQKGWDEHARFMDKLVDEGVIVLGGPIGDVNGVKTMLVCKVKDEAEIRAHLARDPWSGTLLTIAGVQPWTVWLRAKAPV